MQVLVLGGYGLIGAEIVRHLLERGHSVTAIGRDVAKARALEPRTAWVAADIALLDISDKWRPLLQDIDAVVNASGALQTGSRDNLAALQSRAMIALYDAAEAAGIRHIVTISATRARSNANTEFMRTKAAADAHLRASPLDWTILRPGLVIARQAYGGTALLRALAAFPFVIPLISGCASIQTVDVGDVAEAVLAVIDGKVPSRQTYDLVEDAPHQLREIVGEFRQWLGFGPAPVLTIPASLARPVFVIADILGWLGWRSPLRSTAYLELAAGVAGDSASWIASGGGRLKSLRETLYAKPSTAQERWFARMWLLKPIILGTLSLFWLLSGVIAATHPATAAAVLISRGGGALTALALVWGGAVLDVALGLAILVRRTASLAAIGMVLTSCAYLAAGTMLAPDLWADPLGPLVKVLPSIVLALVALAIMDER